MRSFNVTGSGVTTTPFPRTTAGGAATAPSPLTCCRSSSPVTVRVASARSEYCVSCRIVSRRNSAPHGPDSFDSLDPFAAMTPRRTAATTSATDNAGDDPGTSENSVTSSNTRASTAPNAGTKRSTPESRKSSTVNKHTGSRRYPDAPSRPSRTVGDLASTPTVLATATPRAGDTIRTAITSRTWFSDRALHDSARRPERPWTISDWRCRGRASGSLVRRFGQSGSSGPISTTPEHGRCQGGFGLRDPLSQSLRH